MEEFIVELDSDGNVYCWHDIAGGNSFHASTHNGESIELLHFCFQYQELNISEGDIIQKLIVKGFRSASKLLGYK